MNIFLLFAFSLLCSSHLFAGTGTQDVETFKLRNHFGHAEKKHTVLHYTDSALETYYYTCYGRSAKLDDFSEFATKIELKLLDEDPVTYENIRPSFSKLVLEGIFHPEELVGFKYTQTTG